MNDFIVRNHEQFGLDFAKSILSDFNITVIKKGTDNLPGEGRFIFVSNHPLGGFDGILFLVTVSEYFPSVRFMVNDLLMNIKNIHPLFVPINKHGAQAKESVKLIDEIYASDHQICYFPAGLVSRKKRGKIADLDWKKNFIAKAVKHKRDVIPVHITGRVSNRFYRFANLRTFFGIKWNLEMLLLPDEMYKQQGQTFAITFGKPIPYSTFDKSKSTEKWAAEVREEVYRLVT